VTYHGPGQLVAYPVIRIKTFGMGVKAYVSALEETMIRALHQVGIEAERKESCIGTWVRGRKIGSIGVHIRKQVSIHGLALNVNPDLTHFNVITACGIDGVKLTSVKNEGIDLDVEGILTPFTRSFADVFGCELERVEIPSRA
jgi:lipoate-protein ligase B